MKILTTVTSSLIATLSLAVLAPAAHAAPGSNELASSTNIISKAPAIQGTFSARVVVTGSQGEKVLEVKDRSHNLENILSTNELDIADYRSSSDQALEEAYTLQNDEDLVLYKSETAGTSEVITLKAPVETREDPNLTEGEEVIESEGTDGRALKTTINTRNLASDATINSSATEGAVKDSSETKLTVLEAPKPRIVVVGTKAAETAISNPATVNPAVSSSVNTGSATSAAANSVQAPAPSVNSAPPAASGIAGTAMSLIGKPYVFGATGPNAFDCSGLVQYVFAQNGRSVPRVADAQGAAATPINPADIQPGDIIWTGFHIGIYVGNGKIVHAATPATGVILDDLQPYLNQGYRVGRL